MLEVVLYQNAKAAFQRLFAEQPQEVFCGFSLFTDDGATGVDVAANTRDHLAEQLTKPRSARRGAAEEFAARWYTTEWRIEGGYASCFANTCLEIESLRAQRDDEKTRSEVLLAMMSALKRLVDDGVFRSQAKGGDYVVLASITDSEDDAELLVKSIRELNAAQVFHRFLREKAVAGK